MAGVLALLLAVLAAAPAADVTRSLEAVYRAGDYQTNLPAGTPVADSAVAHPSGMPADWFLTDLGALGEVLRVLVWAGAAVGVVLAVIYLARRLIPGALSNRPADEAAVEDAPGLSEAPLHDAHALAREGRFAEAIHVLLLRTLEQLFRAKGTVVAPGWTSREVLARAAYPEQARDALAGLVTAVETCTFGGRPASEDDFRLCEDRFRHLAVALGGRS